MIDNTILTYFDKNKFFFNKLYNIGIEVNILIEIYFINTF